MKEVKGGFKPVGKSDTLDGNKGLGHCITPWGETCQPCTTDEECKEYLVDYRATCIGK